jgi:hypothetical protein
LGRQGALGVRGGGGGGGGGVGGGVEITDKRLVLNASSSRVSALFVARWVVTVTENASGRSVQYCTVAAFTILLSSFS